MNDSSPLRIAVCGNGTVGSGTIEMLRDRGELLSARAGRELRLVRVGARRDRDDCDTGDVPVHRDLLEVTDAEDVDVLVECIGGTTLALDLVERALASGKHVVTANKALIAAHGNALLEAAERAGVTLLFEAAVAGGIPILKALREGMAGNRVDAVAGIINGTGNFILTEMEAARRSFADVLAEAQALGYAEADPTFDVEGIDAAHKLTILAAMAFGTPMNFPAVYCEGISEVTVDDIRFAAELGYRIKHLGIAKRREGGVELRVHPTLVAADAQLARIDGVLNAVSLAGDAAGPTVYSGAGAGRLPTASAVIADLVQIARADGVPIPPLGVPTSGLRSLPVLPREAVCCPWYLRLMALDRPGVMSQLSSCLSAEGISIEALIQKPPKRGAATVPVVLLTDTAREDALRRAVDAITALEVVVEAPHCIRCEGGED
jgi:homoserine dehydrogenase